MAVNLSIKNVPDYLAAQIRLRAAKHHRSLQGELMAILEEMVGQEKRLTPDEVLHNLRNLGLKTPSEAAKFVRRDRDARSNR